MAQNIPYTREMMESKTLLDACARGDKKAVEELLRAGADANGVSVEGWRPLAMAQRGDHAEIIEMLLHAGADVEAQGQHGWTPLVRACYEGSKATVGVLLHHGANPHRYDRWVGWSPLTAVCYRDALDASEIVAMLLHAGAGLEMVDGGGMTALHHACKYGCVVSVDALLCAGADHGAADDDKKTPLALASEYNHPDIVRSLIRAGAALDRRDSDGCTALILACMYDHPESAAALVHAGANKYVEENERRYTALDCAMKWGCAETVAMLAEAHRKDVRVVALGLGEEKSPLSLLVGFGHIYKFIVAMSLPDAILKGPPELQ